MEKIEELEKQADKLKNQYQRMSGDTKEQLDRRLAIANKACLLYEEACKLQKKEN